MQTNIGRIAVLVLAILVVVAGIALALPQRESAQEKPMDVGTPPPVVPADTSPQQPSPVASPLLSQSPLAQNSAPSASPDISASSKPTNTPVPSLSPTEKPQDKPLAGIVIGVDPGHQLHSNSDTEPVAPGSSDMKAKVSSGTQGRFTGVPEHEVNLKVGLLLRDLLKDAGATVVMTRTTADVDISNAERAQVFNKKKVDLGLRIHCNGSDDPSVAGAFMLVPTENPFKDECVAAAKIVLAEYGKATGISVKKGLTYRSDQTGFNWCERPIINIEMGHMTNEAEDHKLTDSDFQKKMAKGLYSGILKYFEQKSN